MKIIDMLRQGRRTVSFEFFPPKNDQGFSDLFAVIEALKPLRPSYVSVTYGAGGSTRRKTVELVKRIRHEIGIEAMAHLTCVGAASSEITSVLQNLHESGIENLLPLRGDPPKGQKTFAAAPGGFRYANELVAFIRAGYDFCLGGACYPETHPEAPSSAVDLENLKRKVDAGVDFLITQLFFDNADFYRFRDKAAAAGIHTPMLAGIMPLLSLKQTKRFAQMCGARIPADLLAKLEPVEDDAEAVRSLGTMHAARQCEQLLDAGVAGLHFYTLNRSTATRAIFQHIKGQLGW